MESHNDHQSKAHVGNGSNQESQLKQVYRQFDKKIVMIGCGSIGQASLPLILRHIDMKPDQITVITKDKEGAEIAKKQGIKNVFLEPLTKDNYQKILHQHLHQGDFLLNLSVDVSSVDLIDFAQDVGALYLDTCIEPWAGAGGYFDKNVSPSLRSNYALRESALDLKKKGKLPTAILTHGANPGLVSHFVKEAMLNIAKDNQLSITEPKTGTEWAQLAQQLGVKVIHIAEQDDQIASKPKQSNEFVNTWSVEGFIAEGSQPAELGWGTHEKHWPHDASRHSFGYQSSIYLNRPGASTRVRTWTPTFGEFHGFLITHGESISISHYLTLMEGGNVVYRPTVHYAYHPCPDAVLSIHQLAGRNWRKQPRERILRDEIISGMDELGVLLMGNQKGAYWYGSQLANSEAKTLAPYNTATSLQVVMGVLSGVLWAMDNPARGIVEPEDLDFRYVMNVSRPYLGNVTGVYTDWTPLKDRESLFSENIDPSCPWQFLNVRVV